MISEERVFLISVFKKNTPTKNIEEYQKEFIRLAESANLFVVKVFTQFLEKPNSKTFIGTGKLNTITNQVKNHRVSALIFNENLSPSQARNISNSARTNVVDRSELILDIFAKHAKTKQAKLQVELAQSEYAYTKLKHLWKHLSRIQGGIGFRGPGEKQIEVDRREVRKKITLLKAKLESIRKTTITKRKNRKKISSISLVGYTNAGKSTLFNVLSNENLYTADQLFATLDATTRSILLKKGKRIVVTDTIGFIRNLPHHLISSFHSTLLEVKKADLLLHVVDISQPNWEELIDDVDKVLHAMQVDEKNILMVFNKCDQLNTTYFSFMKKKLLEKYPDAVFVSAKEKNGIDNLYDKFDEFLLRSDHITSLRVPYKMHSLLSFLYDEAEIINEQLDEENQEKIINLKISRKLYPAVVQQIDNYKLQKYIHK